MCYETFSRLQSKAFRIRNTTALKILLVRLNVEPFNSNSKLIWQRNRLYCGKIHQNKVPQMILAFIDPFIVSDDAKLLESYIWINDCCNRIAFSAKSILHNR